MLILDAMGVLYEAGDDVAELLVPFVGRHGRADLSAEAIDRDYVEASLGQDGHGRPSGSAWASILPWRTPISPAIGLIEGTLRGAASSSSSAMGASPVCRTMSQAGR